MMTGIVKQIKVKHWRRSSITKQSFISIGGTNRPLKDCVCAQMFNCKRTSTLIVIPL